MNSHRESPHTGMRVKLDKFPIILHFSRVLGSAYARMFEPAAYPGESQIPKLIDKVTYNL